MHFHTLSLALAVLATATIVSNSFADPKRTIAPSLDTAAIEMFQAINDKQISLKFIPIDASRGNVLIANQTDAPITLKLPDAFAAVPVLAQLGNQGFGQQGAGGQQGGGGNSQAVGGGMDRGNGGQNAGQNAGRGNPQIGGFMRIAPDRPRKLKAITVCLEYGKPQPNPRIQYTIIPIEKYTDDARIAQLCSQLAGGELAQSVAQAAAWHLANGLDWEKIASLNRMESKYLGNIRFFHSKEIDAAKTYTESFAPSATAVDTTTNR